MAGEGPVQYKNVETCVDDVIREVGKKIVLGLPLALGKPNQFVNALYQRAKKDPEIDLTIFTALSLEKPTWSNDLERRFLEPFIERVFGGYVDLDYVLDLRKRKVPPNVTIREFYTKAGSYLGLSHIQHNYISTNYTHAYRDTLDAGVNVVAQMVCSETIDGRTRYSLSCNPDVSLDIARELWERRKKGAKVAIIAQINQNLPFMYGDAVVSPKNFTAVIDNPAYNTRLFGAPKMAITTQDYMIGFFASALIRDGGTLQIGIGSLGDALCYSLGMRQTDNGVYREALRDTGTLDRFGETVETIGGVDTFDQGLLGSTEMLVDGYTHLMRCGVVKRKAYNHECIQELLNEGRIDETVTTETLKALVDAGAVHEKLTEEDTAFLKKYGVFRERVSWVEGYLLSGDARIEPDLADKGNLDQVLEHCLGTRLKKGILVLGGFFLGPESFYEELRTMNPDERKRIFMTSVLNVNQLYGNEYGNERLKRLQRRHGRFVNACLMVTLSGAVVSDGLENHQAVSGVGGQYNFVSQAHALRGARSILLCRATRAKGREVLSNIVFNYGHITIPRHLRDIVITEYGIAALRGKTDREIIVALLKITDSRFQDELLAKVKEAGKIESGYEIPDEFRRNTPERLEADLAAFRKAGFFQPFPFGTDFTDEELVIGKALKLLKAKMAQGLKKVSSLGRAMTIVSVPEKAVPYLARLGLENPVTAQEKMMQKLVIHALSLTGSI